MKKYFYMAVAAIAVLSSCSNDNEFEPSQTGKQALVFTATMEGSEGTRATYDSDKKCASWEEGDQISINGVNYSAQTAGTTTTFKATTEGEEATGETYNAYFPASLYNNGTPTLPANVSETWAEGKFNMPMYASGSTTDLQFKNLCGVLKITVTPEQLPNVKCITVSSTNCATSGAFTVSGNAAVLTDASNTANTVTVTYTAAVPTDATSKVFYVAIPAQTYKNLSIAINDGKATKVMTTKKGQNITVARNKIYPITFNGQLTTGEADVTPAAGITANQVKWVQLWAGGPKFAEYNVGVTDEKPESDGKLDTWNSGFASYWGDNWRLPKKEELEALINSDNCNVKWINGNTEKYNGTTIAGLLCTGKGAYQDNSIFLPAAGYFDANGTAGQGESGTYWSSTTESTATWCLDFSSSNLIVKKKGAHLGFSFRAVLNETPATTGTAEATINGVKTNVNWVQLWAGGPKFADRNVDGTMTFTDATATSFIWGSNWCTPSKDQLDELLLAASSTGSDKVICEYDGTTKCFIFTGKETGYTDNSVSFPSSTDSDETSGSVIYWSGTTDGGNGCSMSLYYNEGTWRTAWFTTQQYEKFLVRPVLK